MRLRCHRDLPWRRESASKWRYVLDRNDRRSGVAIAKRVWPENSPEWKVAAEERRVYDYRSKLYSKLDSGRLLTPESI